MISVCHFTCSLPLLNLQCRVELLFRAVSYLFYLSGEITALKIDHYYSGWFPVYWYCQQYNIKGEGTPDLHYCAAHHLRVLVVSHPSIHPSTLLLKLFFCLCRCFVISHCHNYKHCSDLYYATRHHLWIIRCNNSNLSFLSLDHSVDAVVVHSSCRFWSCFPFHHFDWQHTHVRDVGQPYDIKKLSLSLVRNIGDV